MKSFFALLVLLAIAFAFFSSAEAQTAIKCNPSGTQAEMNTCAADSYKKADAELNATYKKLMAKVSTAKDKSLLKKAQQAWIKYRDLQCSFNNAGASGGTIYPMVQATCFEQMTKTQTAMLNAQLTCEEGDVTCRH